METTTVISPDIECEGCANAIKKALGSIPGITVVNVDIAEKKISIQHEPQVTLSALTSALDKAGFTVND